MGKLKDLLVGIDEKIMVAVGVIAIIYGGYTYYKIDKKFENSYKEMKQKFVDMKENEKYIHGARWSTENLLPPEKYIQKYIRWSSNNLVIDVMVQEAAEKGLVEIIEK